MTSAKIIYASITGNTEEIANKVKENLENAGVEVSIDEIDSAQPSDFDNFDIAIVATYTYGDGDLPDEAQDFYEELKEADLSDKKYGVLGSGDTSYGENFCKAVELFEEAFKAAGAAKAASGVKVEFAPDTEDDEKNIKKFVEEIIK
ncbi:MAG: flavodoxin [Bifidobacteriaceae bacterium]|jgi:flavodoxin short chain|nr:flavodoxin [Bifidobacteriaceae bacterium]